MESATTARHLRPVGGGPPLVVLADAGTATERELVEEWAAQTHPEAAVMYVGDADLAEKLAGLDEQLVLPVRVTWLPRERDGGRQARAADLLALTNPHRPWSPLQARIRRNEPDRVRVTDGEPATVADMRQRFRSESGTGGGSAAFAAFVDRQAVLACERAERSIIGDRYKVPRLVTEQITASARFRDEVTKLSGKLGRPYDDVLLDAKSALNELVTVQSRLAIDAFRAVMGPMHNRAWNVEVDVESLERLRELNKKHALVFLPSHRAYVDPLVLANVLDEHDFPRNHLLGGSNMAFWPIGPLGKRAGVIFIRRTFGDDQVYKLAIREYFGHLVAKRFNIEWYIEGGRTRTGKLRPPRFGLLHYLVRALDDGRAEDVILVPVSIVYDQQSEVGAMAAEQRGAKKSSEGLKWMADYIRAQRTNAGRAQVVFGEAFSLRGALEEPGEDANRLEKVAFRVCTGINRATPVASTSLVTFALLGTRDRAFTFRQVELIVARVLDLMDERGVAGPLAELRGEHALRATLNQLCAADVVNCYDGGKEPVWSIAPGRHHVAAFYRNGMIHHLINRAIVELALVKLSRGPAVDDPVEAAWEDVLQLRDILKFEFFFADKQAFRLELGVELDRFAPDWHQRLNSPEQLGELLESTPTFVAHRALRSFVDAQMVVARILAERSPREGFDKAQFLDECLGVGRQLLLQGQLHGPESVSQELYAAALQLAQNRDVVDPGRDEVREARLAFLAEIEEVLERVAYIGKLDSARLQKVLDAER
ncbi:Glycerol-3-phosphate acyltransferase [Paraconexibacter sp. AEG42_29]|uniref:Glycerol-3-phosphate acyltransferase n=1 Tax=Paraconexibacter sp. AEG42_29 TaxID=2997339 RepID=A0AAU7B2Q1_9ACTN